METTITELLREFTKVRRAVLSGETVSTQSREGNMRLSLDRPEPQLLVGALRSLVPARKDLTTPTTGPDDWNPSL